MTKNGRKNLVLTLSIMFVWTLVGLFNSSMVDGDRQYMSFGQAIALYFLASIGAMTVYVVICVVVAVSHDFIEWLNKEDK